MRRAVAVHLRPRVAEVLRKLVRAPSTAQSVAERARIVLLASEGAHNLAIAARLGVDRQRVRRWRGRWADAAGMFLSAEAQSVDDDELEGIVTNVLADEPRPGTPPKFSAEQMSALIALACMEPKELGLPFTHWSASDLAREAAKRGIVDRISPRHVARFFGGGGAPSPQVTLLAQPRHRGPGRT